MIAYYRKIQDDINAANQNLYTIVKPVDATAYDKLTNTNQTALATVIDKGRFWVATKSILEAKQASSVSDTVDKNLINKIANLS